MKRALLLFLAACSAGLAYRPPAAVVGTGRFTMTVDEATQAVVLRRDGDALATFDAQAFQLGLAAADPAASWDPSELEGSAAVTWAQPRAWTLGTETPARIALDYGAGVRAYVVVSSAGEGRFTLSFVPEAATAVLARVVVRTTPGESFYGLGASRDRVERRGTFHPMQASTAGDPHAPIPLVVSTRGWGIVAVSQRVGAFDVARRDPGAVEATYAVAPLAGTTTDALRLDVLAGDGPLDVYRGYGATTTPPVAPPLWSLGPWFWRANATAASLAADAQQIRDLDLAISGLGASTSTATAPGAFDLDPARFPDPAGVVPALHALGFHAGIWSAPYSSRPDATPFLPPTSPVARPPIDLTTGAAGTFWRGLVGRYAALGFDAFLLDGGEDIVPSRDGKRAVWSFASGDDERTMHARYPSILHSVYIDAVTGQDPTQPRILDPKPPALFVRATRPDDVGAIFRQPGTITSFADLAATVTENVALSASGVPFAVADTGPADTDLLARSIEASALFPIMSLVDVNGVAPWTTAPELVRRYARLHLRLYPFFATHALHVAERPVVRPLGWVDPLLSASDAFVVGDELLVAPVLVAGATARDVTFPAGRWFGWTDGAAREGTARIDAALAELPLFVREGAIVPLLRDTIGTLASTTSAESFTDHPGPLHAVIAPGPARSFVLFDGARIARTGTGTLEVADGSSFKEGFVLELIATARPGSVLRNDDPVESWSWSPERGGTLRIPLPAGAATIVLR